jgi:hypothetical protein
MEATILNSFDHPHIIRCFGVALGPPSIMYAPPNLTRLHSIQIDYCSPPTRRVVGKGLRGPIDRSCIFGWWHQVHRARVGPAVPLGPTARRWQHGQGGLAAGALVKARLARIGGVLSRCRVCVGLTVRARYAAPRLRGQERRRVSSLRQRQGRGRGECCPWRASCRWRERPWQR